MLQLSFPVENCQVLSPWLSTPLWGVIFQESQKPPIHFFRLSLLFIGLLSSYKKETLTKISHLSYPRLKTCRITKLLKLTFFKICNKQYQKCLCICLMLQLNRPETISSTHQFQKLRDLYLKTLFCGASYFCKSVQRFQCKSRRKEWFSF